MAETKYGEYIKKLTFQDYGPGFYRQGVRMDGEFLCGLDVNITYGTYREAGKMGKEPYEPHVHDFDEILFFMGADMDNLLELGAQIELCLGEEKEKQIINTPTAVVLPAGFAHFPAEITRLDKRFISMAVSLAGEWKVSERLTSDRGQAETTGIKYKDKVQKLSFRRKGAYYYRPDSPDDSGGVITYVPGSETGLDLHISYESVKAPYRFGFAPYTPHAHAFEEVLLFMGTDTDDLSKLGGEAEICLGKEKEKHVINTPAAVACPRNFVHIPLTVTKVERPFIFVVISLAAEHLSMR